MARIRHASFWQLSYNRGLYSICFGDQSDKRLESSEIRNVDPLPDLGWIRKVKCYSLATYLPWPEAWGAWLRSNWFVQANLLLTMPPGLTQGDLTFALCLYYRPCGAFMLVSGASTETVVFKCLRLWVDIPAQTLAGVTSCGMLKLFVYYWFRLCALDGMLGQDSIEWVCQIATQGVSISVLFIQISVQLRKSCLCMSRSCSQFLPSPEGLPRACAEICTALKFNKM